MFDRYLTTEQIEQLRERRRELGDEAGTRAAQEWTTLIAEAEAARRDGLDPANPLVQDIARRWKGLIDRVTGGDKAILRSLETMIEAEGIATVSRGTITPELRDFVTSSLVSTQGDDSQ